MMHYLTIDEAAALIGCTASNVRHLIRTGQLPAERKGRYVTLIRAADVRKHGGRKRAAPKIIS